MDGSIFCGGVSIGIKLAALTLPLIVYVMTQALDDYKTEVDAVYEEHEVGSGETSGVAEDAPSTSESTEEVGNYNEDSSRQSNIDDTTSGTNNVPTDNVSATSDWLTFESTAYIALCDTGCTGITFTGVDVRSSIYYEGDRVIAVDPAVIPLGSRVEIRLSDGATFTARAIDTGGAINGHMIDLLVATEAEAWAYGRQQVELRVLGD